MPSYYILQRGPFRLILDQKGVVQRAFTPRGILDGHSFHVLGSASAHSWEAHVEALEAVPLDESSPEARGRASQTFLEWATRLREATGIDAARTIQAWERATKGGRSLGFLPNGEEERLAAMRTAGRSFQAQDGLCYDTIRLWVDTRSGEVFHGAPPLGRRSSGWATHLDALSKRHP